MKYRKDEAKEWVARNWHGLCNVIIPSYSSDLKRLNESGIRHDVSDRQITLFKSLGTAVQEIALAVKIYQKARELGLGEKLDDFPVISDKSPPRIRH